jgi:hypothetical protein
MQSENNHLENENPPLEEDDDDDEAIVTEESTNKSPETGVEAEPIETSEVEDEPTEPETESEIDLTKPQPEEQTSKGSFFKRVLRFLFSPDTRVGRFLRPVLRVTALVIGMLAIGLLVSYFTLYLPVRSQRDQALAEIQRINLDLENTQSELTQTQDELNTIKDSTSTTISDLEEKNKLANFKVYFLIAKNDVLRARLALLDDANGPGGPTALAALNDLDSHLQDLIPYVDEVDPVLANLLQDLESFYSNLLELEDTLFK